MEVLAGIGALIVLLELGAIFVVFMIVQAIVTIFTRKKIWKESRCNQRRGIN